MTDNTVHSMMKVNLKGLTVRCTILFRFDQSRTTSDTIVFREFCHIRNSRIDRCHVCKISDVLDDATLFLRPQWGKQMSLAT